ncbi:hypothetical protein D3C72_2086150 [compost metagenome]
MMPRTRISTASAKASENCFIRFLPRKPTTQRGRPRPAATPMPSVRKMFSPATRAIRKPTTPTTTLMITKVRRLIDKPACFSLAAMVMRALRSRRSTS